MNRAPERGIAMTTAELSSEEAEPVLDAVTGAGANAISLTTSLVVEAAPDEGLREPPLDVEGERRILDRPLWGKRALRVHRYAVHEPDPDLWRDLPWSPPVTAPNDIRVDYVRQAIEAARERHLRVYAQLTPYTLPGATGGQDSMIGSDDLRDDYRPRRFVGGPHPDGIAFTGCLNHPAVRQLGRVRMRELLRNYGDVDGVSIDWVEYPVYFLDKVFTCFCEHCHSRAISLGYDWDAINRAVRELWDSLHTLTPDRLEALIASGDWGDLVTDPDRMQPGFNAWFEFKAESVALALKDLRETMNDAGGEHLLLATSGFALPWGRMTGGAYAHKDGAVDYQRIKLYSFHWLMMVRWWANTMLLWNKGSSITPNLATRALLSLFSMSLQDAPAELSPDDFGMPGPEDDHNLTRESYTYRIENALAIRQYQAPLIPYVHGYRPAEDFARLLETIRPFTQDGLWIQRYGYLSDEKLAILQQEWSRTT